jgi:hypothetical protein
MTPTIALTFGACSSVSDGKGCGSVLRYEVDEGEEDWLNDVVPALMLFRSYVVAKGITLKFFTLDTHSVARIDLSDPDEELGFEPDNGDDIFLHKPTNIQSSKKRIRRGIDALIDLFSPPPTKEEEEEEED